MTTNLSMAMIINNEVESMVVDDEKVFKSKELVVDYNVPKKSLVNKHEAKATKKKD